MTPDVVPAPHSTHCEDVQKMVKAPAARVQLQRNGQVETRHVPGGDVTAHFEDCVTNADDAIYEAEIALLHKSLATAVAQLGEARR